MLLTKSVMVRWNGANKKWYEERGYKWTRLNDLFECDVKDLPPTAKNFLTICCDKCGKGIKTIKVESYNERYKEEYLCQSCKNETYVCVVCGKIDKHRGLYEDKYYCSKHLSQMKRYGKILKRTRFDANDFIIHNDYAEMLIYNKDGEAIESTFISLDKVDLVKPYKWCLKVDKKKPEYKRVVTSWGNKKTTTIHRMIMGIQDSDSSIDVDHIDGNPLNNRNENLRICSCLENNRNHTKLFSTNTSGYTGIDWHKASGKWRARVKLHNQDVYLGIFASIEDAIIAREKAELEVYGEFSPHFNELKEKYPDIYEKLINNKGA